MDKMTTSFPKAAVVMVTENILVNAGIRGVAFLFQGILGPNINSIKVLFMFFIRTTA